MILMIVADADAASMLLLLLLLQLQPLQLLAFIIVAAVTDVVVAREGVVRRWLKQWKLRLVL